MGCSFETAKERIQCGNNSISNYKSNSNNCNYNTSNTHTNIIKNKNRNIFIPSSKEETKNNQDIANANKTQQQITTASSISGCDDGINFQNKEENNNNNKENNNNKDNYNKDNNKKDNNKDNNPSSNFSELHTTRRGRGQPEGRGAVDRGITTGAKATTTILTTRKTIAITTATTTPRTTGVIVQNKQLARELTRQQPQGDSGAEAAAEQGADEEEEEEKEEEEEEEQEVEEDSVEDEDKVLPAQADKKIIDRGHSSYCQLTSLQRRATSTCDENNSKHHSDCNRYNNNQNNTKITSICCHLSNSSWRQSLHTKEQQQQEADPQQQQADQRQQQPDQRHQQLGVQPKGRRCNHAEETETSKTSTPGSSYSRAIRNLPEMLLHARNCLATYLTQAGNSFVAAATIVGPLMEQQKKEKLVLDQELQRRGREKRLWSLCWEETEEEQMLQQRTRCKHCQQHDNSNNVKSRWSNNNSNKKHNNSKTKNHDHCELSCRRCNCNYSNIHNSKTSSNNNYNYNYNTLRNSISLYAASSVLLVLCCLTTTTSAAATNSNTATLEKHPIQGIDWSKFDESSSDKEILDLLLEKKRYDKRLLPPVNDEDFCCGLSSPDMAKDSKTTMRSHNRGTLTVNVNVLLLSLASPDESSLKYEVEFLLNQQWNDPRLQYGNKSQYDYLNALHHHDNIWTPDTYFIMHGDFKDPIIPMHFALRIYRNGTITYAMRRHLILSCQGSLHIFPFDDPKCSFSMESISYEEAQIKYVWKNDEDTLRKSPSLTTLNAYLIKNQTTACDQNSWRGNYSCLRVDLIFTRDRAFYFTTVFIPGIILVTSSFITFWLEWNAVPARSMIGNYSCLQVELTFTRDRAYYFTTVFIPGIILVTSSFITFWLEWNAVPARVMIGVTTMLNFFTTSNGFRSTLPVVSNLTAMNVWDGVCMCFIYASLLEFVCVNYVGRKRPLHNVVYRPGENPVTQRLPAVLSRIGVILASPLAAAGISSSGGGGGFLMTPATMTPPTPASPPPPTAAPSAAQSQPPPSAPPVMTSTMVAMEQQHGSIIGAAVQNLRARSVKYRKSQSKDEPTGGPDPIYTEPVFETPPPTAPVDDAKATTTATATATATTPTAVTTTTTAEAMTTVTLEDDIDDVSDQAKVGGALDPRQWHSVATNTPALVQRGIERARVDVGDMERMERQLPVKPPRKKTSRSTSPAGLYFMEMSPGGGDEGVVRRGGASNGVGRPGLPGSTAADMANGEKRREASAPNEIVACTSCGGGNSPCTHSANNGCATETCFVQVRKKEPPHPIRVAKTIDVIARITFPTAYSIFLIFFFVHYKGFS